MGEGRVTASQLETARQLLSAEGGGDGVSEAAARVFDKLHLHLDLLLGVGGVRALFVRASRLAREEHPCISSAAEGGAQLRECLDAVPEAAAREAAVAFFASFLSVISGFIGAALTVEILRGAWPTVTHFADKESNQ